MFKTRIGAWIILAIVIVLFITSHAGLIYAADKEPIKIGVLNVDSGNYADWGYLQKCGFIMALEDYKEEVLGRPITLIQADTEGNPDVAGRRAKSAPKTAETGQIMAQ